eukprot:CAMPEP_0197542124 /NCGR_PEP_ID=MMETSP1318-20131121/67537_1 /TAXON_ID=552666 /ORGANISM="Partenskyella glossopodia, Strain RCC365" /LENGTH=132 /DNA_ID=CAMNT_0043101367 /DNA_START=348 /DNA_END=743 /DNA_ORIENTATION=-
MLIIGNETGDRFGAVNGPTMLVDMVTYVKDSPNELTSDTRQQSVEIISNITNNDLNEFSDDVVRSSISGLNNIMYSSAESEEADSYELETLGFTVETTLGTIGTSVAERSPIGENPKVMAVRGFRGCWAIRW